MAASHNKIPKNLNNWAWSHLNMAGKLVLLKATLDSLPIYGFNFFIMPKGIKKRINIIRRNFLWGNNKLRLVNWHLVTSNKNRGGLGVTDLEQRNLAMMFKNC